MTKFTVYGLPGVYNVGGMTLTDGSGSALAVDENGRIIISDTTPLSVDTELTTDDLDTGVGTDTRAVVGLVGSASGGGQLIPGSATDGLLVNLGSNNDVTITGGVTADTELTTADLDTGGGTDTRAVVGLVLAESGGGVLVGSANPLPISGNIAHDGIDAGSPVKLGGVTIAHGTNPTTVAAADRTNWYFNRAGVPFVIGGHPNPVTKNFQVTDSDGAQTDADILGAISTGTKYVITRYEITADNANTVDVSVRLGFGSSSTPAADAAGVLTFHPGIVPGGGLTSGNGGGILGVGGDGEELRLTCEDPVSGSISITITYYTVAS